MRKPGSSGEVTLRNLRSAALRLLSEQGYGAMNLRTLASSVGMQAGSLYNYIESKQQLLFWLSKEITEKLLAEFDASVGAIADPAQQMGAFVAFHLDYHFTNLKQSLILSMEMRSLTAANYRVISALQRLYTAKVLDIVERGVAAGEFKAPDPQITTFAILQMLTAVTRWYRSRGRLSREQLIATYTEMIFAMLGAAERPSRYAPGRVAAKLAAEKIALAAKLEGDYPDA